MTRTTFRPSAAISASTATIHHRTPAGGLEKDAFWTGMGTLEFPSGGGGLFSTLHDYARFAQMLLNGGELDGARVLGPKTVEMMRSNQIAYIHMPESAFVPPGFGFGVRVWPADAHKAPALGSPGEFGWDGAATTYVSMDPKEHVLLLLLMQHVPFDEGGIFEKFEDTAYQALESGSP
jgi:CubicO group peptidase (beta-lactamase class C family)